MCDDESRLISLETQIAYAEDLLQSLNETVIAQDRRLLALERRFEQLLEQLKGAQASDLRAPPEPPPHY